MKFVVLVLCCGPALAGSISVTGSCSQPVCNTTIYDQFGDAWGGAGSDIVLSSTGVVGNVYTDLGVIGADQYYHPGATAPNPSEQFNVEVDLPRVPGILDVYISTVSKCDEYYLCGPTLTIDGLSGGVDIGEGVTEYVNVPPVQVFLSGLVTTTTPDSTDSLGFDVYYVDPPFFANAPEPALWPVGLLSLSWLAWRFLLRHSSGYVRG